MSILLSIREEKVKVDGKKLDGERTVTEKEHKEKDSDSLEIEN